MTITLSELIAECSDDVGCNEIMPLGCASHSEYFTSKVFAFVFGLAFENEVSLR